jgi:hypothetical protein
MLAGTEAKSTAHSPRTVTRHGASIFRGPVIPVPVKVRTQLKKNAKVAESETVSLATHLPAVLLLWKTPAVNKFARPSSSAGVFQLSFGGKAERKSVHELDNQILRHPTSAEEVFKLLRSEKVPEGWPTGVLVAQHGLADQQWSHADAVNGSQPREVFFQEIAKELVDLTLLPNFGEVCLTLCTYAVFFGIGEPHRERTAWHQAEAKPRWTVLKHTDFKIRSWKGTGLGMDPIKAKVR